MEDEMEQDAGVGQVPNEARMDAPAAGPAASHRGASKRRHTDESDHHVARICKKIPTTLSMKGGVFTQRFFLMLNSFGSVIATAINGATTSYYYCTSMYNFDPGLLGMYLNQSSKDFLNNLIGKCNLKVNRIKGQLNVYGQNSPFITNSSEQAATNANITVVAARASGLENSVLAVKGTYTPVAGDPFTLTRWSPGSPNIDQFTQTRTTGTPSVTNGGVVKISQVDPNDQFKAWNATLGLPVQLSGGSSAQIVNNKPDFMKNCEIIDLNLTEGPVLEWDHKMDTYIGVQPVVNQLKYGQSFGVHADLFTTGNATSEGNSITIGRQSYNGVEAAIDGTTRLNSHNVYRLDWDHGTQRIKAPRNEQFIIVPPNTLDETTVQAVTIYAQLDTQLEFEIDYDNMYGDQSGVGFQYQTAMKGHAAMYKNIDFANVFGVQQWGGSNIGSVNANTVTNIAGLACGNTAGFADTEPVDPMQKSVTRAEMLQIMEKLRAERAAPVPDK